MNLIRLGVSPITGNVYAGRRLRNGCWGANKEDVTPDFLACVIEKFHPLPGQSNMTTVILDKDGCPAAEIRLTMLGDG